jgi:phosphoglycolate phosphatase
VLLLFDIDGTLLVGAAREHAAALHWALHEVYGIGPGVGDTDRPVMGGAAVGRRAPRVEAAGRTDFEIARAVLVGSGVSAERIDERAEDFRAACFEEYCRRCPASLEDRVVPGMVALLDSLSARREVILALVTGNLEPIARLKLARAGIGGYFPTGQGGFGSDSEDRLDLPPIARRRAGRGLAAADGRAPAAYPRSRTLIIGDTPRDIACARADGVRCLAVTTGPFRAEQLQSADAVASDAAHLRELLNSELSSTV